MDIATIITVLQTVVSALPGAVTTVEQLVALGQKFFTATNGTDPTDADIAALRAGIDSDVAAALQPLPAPQPGDPDYVAPGGA